MTPEELNDFPVVTALDLFRFTGEGLPLIDLTPGGSPYFSIDGGNSKLSEFATGESFGEQTRTRPNGLSGSQ
jgi:hypothetical protein